MKNIIQLVVGLFFISSFTPTSFAQDLELVVVDGTSKVSLNSDLFIEASGEVTTNNFYRKTQLLDAETVEITYFNQQDNIVAKRYYNSEGELYYDDKGVAIYEYDYDKYGNTTEIRYYNEFKMPYHIDEIGPAAIKKEYDSHSRVIKVSYFDKQGELYTQVFPPIIEYSYNDMDQIIEERQYNGKGKLVDFVAAIIRYTYDKEGRIKTQSYFDANGEAVNMMMDSSDETDFTKIVFEYNDGQAFSKFYDLRGNEIEPY